MAAGEGFEPSHTESESVPYNIIQYYRVIASVI